MRRHDPFDRFLRPIWPFQIIRVDEQGGQGVRGIGGLLVPDTGHVIRFIRHAGVFDDESGIGGQCEIRAPRAPAPAIIHGRGTLVYEWNPIAVQQPSHLCLPARPIWRLKRSEAILQARCVDLHASFTFWASLATRWTMSANWPSVRSIIMSSLSLWPWSFSADLSRSASL